MAHGATRELIGRDAEVQHIHRLMDAALRGEGQVMLISGEAGIGKSRLVAELKRAAGEAWHLREGRCFEQDRALPYAPLMELTDATMINSANEPAASLLTEQDKRKFFDAMAETLLLSQKTTSKASLIVIMANHKRSNWCWLTI